MGDVASGQVLVVSADERWLRVLEVTLRLGGAVPISRRSAREALGLSGTEAVSAIVLDLAQSSGDELDVVRGLLGQSSLPAVVILPERLAGQSEMFAAAGATVLVRPYRPSELYAALRITESALTPADDKERATAARTTPAPSGPAASPEPPPAEPTPAEPPPAEPTPAEPTPPDPEPTSTAGDPEPTSSEADQAVDEA